MSSVYGLVWGTLIGSAIELLVLIIILQYHGWSFFPSWYGMMKQTRIILNEYKPMIVGSFLMGSTSIVDQIMASMLELGSVATLNYGNKIVSLLVGLISGALGTAIFPLLSRQVAQKDWNGLKNTQRKYTDLVVKISIPSLCVLF